MKNFNIVEFNYSELALKLNIDNTIPTDIISVIENFVTDILDPLADAWYNSKLQKIIITSGYRCEALDKAANSDGLSPHCKGLAVDIVPENGDIADFKMFVLKWLDSTNIAFDLFIIESDKGAEWVHIGYRSVNNELRKMYLLYLAGLLTSIDPKTYDPKLIKAVNVNKPSSVSPEMINMICKFEKGKNFGYKMELKDLEGKVCVNNQGVPDTNPPHKTYGYGLLVHPNGKYMDTIKSTYTLAELELLYMQTVNKNVSLVLSLAPNVNLNQLDAIVCACYNFGPGFIKKYEIGKMIQKNPNDPAIYNKWVHQSDKQAANGFPGLAKRRLKEADWYIANNATMSTASILTTNEDGTVTYTLTTYDNLQSATDNQSYTSTTNSTGYGKLVGKSVYLNDYDLNAMSKNSTYKKDDEGKPIISTVTGKPIPSDLYITKENEKTQNSIESIDEVQPEKVYTEEELKEEKRKEEEYQKQIEEEKKQEIKELRRKLSIKNWKKKSKDPTSKEEVKVMLMDWLKKQSLILQNAFLVLVIKDLIDSIKDLCEKMQNCSIENLADLVNNIQDIFGFFETLGFTPDALGITIDDIKALALAASTMAVQLGQNVSDLMYKNVQAANATMLTDVLQAAKTNATNAMSMGGDALNNIVHSVDQAKNSLDMSDDISSVVSSVSDKTNGVTDRISGGLNTISSEVTTLTGNVSNSVNNTINNANERAEKSMLEIEAYLE